MRQFGVTTVLAGVVAALGVGAPVSARPAFLDGAVKGDPEASVEMIARGGTIRRFQANNVEYVCPDGSSVRFAYWIFGARTKPNGDGFFEMAAGGDDGDGQIARASGRVRSNFIRGQGVDVFYFESKGALCETRIRFEIPKPRGLDL